MTYRDELLNFSKRDKLLTKSLIKLNDPVYFCRLVPGFEEKYDHIKNYILDNSSLDSESVINYNDLTLAPATANINNESYNIIIVMSSDSLSVLVDKCNFDKLLNELSTIIKRDL